VLTRHQRRAKALAAYVYGLIAMMQLLQVCAKPYASRGQPHLDWLEGTSAHTCMHAAAQVLRMLHHDLQTSYIQTRSSLVRARVPCGPLLTTTASRTLDMCAWMASRTAASCRPRSLESKSKPYTTWMSRVGMLLGACINVGSSSYMGPAAVMQIAPCT